MIYVFNTDGAEYPCVPLVERKYFTPSGIISFQRGTVMSRNQAFTET